MKLDNISSKENNFILKNKQTYKKNVPISKFKVTSKQLKRCWCHINVLIVSLF